MICAGTPIARAPGGTTLLFPTTAFAATVAPVPTTARCRITEPEPASDSSSSVQPSRCARCPTTQREPTTVGNMGTAWTTLPSWMLVSSPTTIRP